MAKEAFLSSASDPLHPVVVKLAGEVLRRALAGGTFVVISTKAMAPPEVVKILSQYPDQVSYTVSVSSLGEERNRLLEPNAPSARERLHGKRQAMPLLERPLRPIHALMRYHAVDIPI
jgi:DNA repair photolyase